MQTFEEIAEEYAKEKGYDGDKDEKGKWIITPIDEIWIYEGLKGMAEVGKRLAQQAIEAQREAIIEAMDNEREEYWHYQAAVNAPLITLK